MREMWRVIRNWRRCFALLGVLALLAASLRNPAALKSYFYGAFREGSRLVLDLQNQHLLVLEGKNFRVQYQDLDANVAGLVLDTAESIFTSVNQSLGFVPTRKVPVVIYPDEQSLARCFGWPADEAALGVYWIGTIRILSPNVWAAGPDGTVDAAAFIENGPMAHEYTHYVIDYLTGGNYPRWFTEGVAQWQEKRLTGFAFSNPFWPADRSSRDHPLPAIRGSGRDHSPAEPLLAVVTRPKAGTGIGTVKPTPIQLETQAPTKTPAEIRTQTHMHTRTSAEIQTPTRINIETQTPRSVSAQLYPLSEMDTHFDSLPNQMLAYWESLQAIEYIDAEFGPEQINQIIGCLGQGRSLNRALEGCLGVNLQQFDQDFRQWAARRAADL